MEAFKIDLSSIGAELDFESLVDIFSSREATGQCKSNVNLRHEGSPADYPSTSLAGTAADAYHAETSQPLVILCLCTFFLFSLIDFVTCQKFFSLDFVVYHDSVQIKMNYIVFGLGSFVSFTFIGRAYFLLFIISILDLKTFF